MSEIVLRIQVPAQKLQKAIRINSNDTVLSLANKILDKFPDLKDKLNYGVLLREGKNGGKFLLENKTLSFYNIDATVPNI